VETSFHGEQSVVDFFRERAWAQPAFPAVEEGDRVLTYGELDLRSQLVANELARRGLQLEEPAAILIPASGDYVVAMLGVLKAGGSYLPMDPGAPVKRLEQMLQDSGSRFVLTNAAGIQRLAGWPGSVLDVAEITGQSSLPARRSPALASLEAPEIPGVSSDPNRRAYIIYTSGSTGQPKGVEIEHHSLTNLVRAYQKQFDIAARDRNPLFANVAFDASVADVWPALCAGGSLVIPPDELYQNPDGLIAWLAAGRITWTFLPTGLAEILFARPWPAQMPLRFLMAAGDRLRVRPPGNLPCIVFNGYGPTENTVYSTWSVVKPQNGNSKLPAIGRPIANVRAYVLDECGQPAGNGEPGELYLGGEQVARGYLGKPALSAERFIADPFTGRPQDRMYRTGDWVRWLADGELDFLGRRDEQVQIRGNRVELGEIEAALVAHRAVRQACCLPRWDNGVAAGIVAHIVPAKEGGDCAAELGAHLGALLPGYMTPSQFVFHGQFPLTPHGKVDRTALVNMHPKTTAAPQAEAPTDGLEIALSRLWHALLPEARNSPGDTRFGALGGDSLLMVRLMLGVEEITNQRLEVSTFLSQPTFSGLCQAVRTRMMRTEFQPVLALRKQGTRPAIFCVHQFNGDIDAYFDLAQALGNDQPVFGIRSPALEDPSRLPASIEAAAAEVVRSIRKIQPGGVPALVGYSWANLLAFEVARQLAEKEGISCFTALIGTDAPMLPANLTSRLAHFVRNVPAWAVDYIMDDNNRLKRLLRWRRKLVHGKLAKIHLPMFGTPISSHMIDLMDKYRPPPESGVSIDLFRDRDSYQAAPHPLRFWERNDLPDGGWSHWTRQRVRVHWQEGDHVSMIRTPAVSGLAQSILQAMNQHLSATRAEREGDQTMILPSMILPESGCL
jgi:amino acid adenylation domain-containing protein